MEDHLVDMLPSRLPSADHVARALRARRGWILDAWTSAEGALSNGVVVVPAGVPIPVLGTDNVHGFHAHDDHQWLSGAGIPAGVLVCDPQEDGGHDAFALYAYRPDAEDRVWHGDGVSFDELARITGLEAIRPLDELADVLARLGRRPVALIGQTDLLERPGAYGLAPSAFEGLALDADLSLRVERAVHARRRVKDEVELAFMRAAAAATVAGHLEARRIATPGMTERALQVELETTFLRHGADHPAYGSIVAAGSNAATLHIHPTDRRLAGGDLVLIDAGAEVAGYDCDVTRTFPVDNRFTAEQQAVYDIVLGVQQRAIEGVRPGAEFRDLHLEAALGIADGLVGMGVMKGRPQDLVERDAHALFFPHGLGHLIGLSTHDVGGYLEGRVRSERRGLRYLRANLPLEAGYVLTIEPGIYFIDALLGDATLRERYRDDVDWTRADALLPLGGVRIEDTVHVTDGAPEVLSAAAPK